MPNCDGDGNVIEIKMSLPLPLVFITCLSHMVLLLLRETILTEQLFDILFQNFVTEFIKFI